MISIEEFITMPTNDKMEYIETLSDSGRNELKLKLQELCKDDEKLCSRCFNILPKEEFYRDEKSSDKLAYWCKGCMSSYRKEKYNTDKANNEYYQFAEEILTELIFPHADRVTLNKEANILKGHYRNNQELMKDLGVMIEKFGIETRPIPQIQEIEISTQKSFWDTLREKIAA
jgi:hypothetical protein